MNKVIEKGDIEMLEHIVSLKKIESTEVYLMQNFILKYIDNKCFICTTCPAQIRFAHSRIEKWSVKNSSIIDEIKNGHSCYSCGKILKDRRRKICEICKEKI
jgi:hypothetical protein